MYEELQGRENLTAFGWRTPEEPRAAKGFENPRFSMEPLFGEEGFLLSWTGKVLLSKP